MCIVDVNSGQVHGDQKDKATQSNSPVEKAILEPVLIVGFLAPLQCRERRNGETTNHQICHPSNNIKGVASLEMMAPQFAPGSIWVYRLDFCLLLAILLFLSNVVVEIICINPKRNVARIIAEVDEEEKSESIHN